MPYIEPGKRKELLTEPSRATTPGDWNYLFSEAILRVWNAHPKYDTLDLLEDQQEINNVDVVTEILAVYEFLTSEGVPERKVKKAYRLAYREFYARIGRAYEFHKMNQNGDLPGYTEALLHLNNLAREDFNSRIKYEEKK